MEDVSMIDSFINMVNSITEDVCLEKSSGSNSEINLTQIKRASDSPMVSALNDVAKAENKNMIECQSELQANGLTESRESLLLTLLDSDISTPDKIKEEEDGDEKLEVDKMTDKQTNETKLGSGRSTSQKLETDVTITSLDNLSKFEKQGENQFQNSNTSKVGQKVENMSTSSNLETFYDKNAESAAKNIKTERARRPLFKRKLKSSSPRSSRKVKTQSLNDTSNAESTTASQPNRAEKCLYTPGMVVWARIPGYTYWPAMIDNDPDTHWHFWPTDDVTTSPTHYHVVFFDTNNRLSRSWVKPNNIKLFTEVVRINSTRPADYLERFKESVKEAQDAASLNVKERLKKYSFSERIKLPGMKLCQD